MKKILVATLYIMLTIILVYHPQPISNVNVNVITETITSFNTTYDSFSTVTTSTISETTTVFKTVYKYFTTSTKITVTVMNSSTVSMYVQSTYTTQVTYYLKFFVEGDQKPNVVFIKYYVPTDSIITTNAFGKNIIISSGQIIEFVTDNTTSVILPLYSIDNVVLRHLFTLADENYMSLVHAQFLQICATHEMSSNYYDFLCMIKQHYTIESTYDYPQLPHIEMSKRTIDQYFLSDIFLINNVEMKNTIRIFFPISHPGYIMSVNGRYYYNMREFKNLPAVVIANSLDSKFVIGEFNKYFCFVNLIETSISVPSIIYPKNKFTYYGTKVYGSSTNIIVIVMSGNSGYLQTNSDPIKTIRYDGGTYYILSNNITETKTNHILPFLFWPENAYYIAGNEVVARYITKTDGQNVVWSGTFSITSNTILYSYYEKYESGATILKESGKIIIG